jgi:hypothetical protein
MNISAVRSLLGIWGNSNVSIATRQVSECTDMRLNRSRMLCRVFVQAMVSSARMAKA